MKSCEGCKYLVGRHCIQHYKYERIHDKISNTTRIKLLSKLRTAEQARKEGECGRERKLFKPTFTHRYGWIIIVGLIVFIAYYAMGIK